MREVCSSESHLLLQFITVLLVIGDGNGSQSLCIYHMPRIVLGS